MQKEDLFSLGKLVLVLGCLSKNAVLDVPAVCMLLITCSALIFDNVVVGVSCRALLRRAEESCACAVE